MAVLFFNNFATHPYNKVMGFYDVGVSSSRYHGSAPLTYASDKNITAGTVVEVPLRGDNVWGVVLATDAPKPSVAAKDISTIYNEVQLPKAQLKLLQWLRLYYPAPLSSIVQLFLPSKIDDVSPVDKERSPKPTALPKLTKQQQAALDKLARTKSTTALLHGDTGTGKTRIYIELAKDCLGKGRSVIVLVPEIGLVPQMVHSFEEQFPSQVHSIHSGLTDKQRRQIWRQVHDNDQPQVVIGPRSALFLPVRQVGLVVVDEAHDNGYKQDQQPYYEASRVAAKLAGLSKAFCLYGTATPRLADYWQLTDHGTPVLRLTEPIHARIKTPQHTIIDASDREQFKRSAIFSEPLLAAIGARLAKREQSLIFLNRRGTARFVSCAVCGWHASCPICDTPLTYHGDQHQLRCHTCGIKQSVPTSCPNCGSAELRYQRRGTKALQTELEKLFPQARVARFDSDNTTDETLARQYDKLAAGDIDILVGTQVIAKGLDLSNLSLVAIPQADLSSYLPDFTADEQTYQLLRQVVGRVGRTDKASQVIVQTYHPDSPIIEAALTNDWPEFYQQQIEHRKKYNFPPFTYLLKLTVTRTSAASARQAGEKLKIQLEKASQNLEVLGPAPSFHEKVRGKYQWQLVVKAPRRQMLLKIIPSLPSGWRYNLDPTNLL